MSQRYEGRGKDGEEPEFNGDDLSVPAEDRARIEALGAEWVDLRESDEDKDIKSADALQMKLLMLLRPVIKQELANDGSLLPELVLGSYAMEGALATQVRAQSRRGFEPAFRKEFRRAIHDFRSHGWFADRTDLIERKIPTDKHPLVTAMVEANEFQSLEDRRVTYLFIREELAPDDVANRLGRSVQEVMDVIEGVLLQATSRTEFWRLKYDSHDHAGRLRRHKK